MLVRNENEYEYENENYKILETMKQFGGEVLFLDRSDINTDEIIPAKYLEETEQKVTETKA